MGSFMKALGAAVTGQTTSYSLSQVEQSNHYIRMFIRIFSPQTNPGGGYNLWLGTTYVCLGWGTVVRDLSLTT